MPMVVVEALIASVLRAATCFDALCLRVRLSHLQPKSYMLNQNIYISYILIPNHLKQVG